MTRSNQQRVFVVETTYFHKKRTRSRYSHSIWNSTWPYSSGLEIDYGENLEKVSISDLLSEMEVNDFGQLEQPRTST